MVLIQLIHQKTLLNINPCLHMTRILINFFCIIGLSYSLILVFTSFIGQEYDVIFLSNEMCTLIEKDPILKKQIIIQANNLSNQCLISKVKLVDWDQDFRQIIFLQSFSNSIVIRKEFITYKIR